MNDAMDNTPEKTSINGRSRGAARAESRTGRDLRLGVPSSRAMDEQILNAARDHSVRRNRMRWTIRYAVGSVAAAAAVILIAIKMNRHDQPIVNNPAPAIATAEDFNRDGKLDMIDAFLMARKVVSAETSQEWDFNHDGAVDTKDVDVVAFAAVKLKGGENP